MITIENTSYGYKSNPLIFNISLEIGNGIYGLLGENGVGKTTLMHLICGLLFPKNGKCSIDGRNTAERQSEGLARYFFLPEELQMPTESIASFAARHSVFYPHFNQEEFKLNLEELKINRKQKLSSVSYGQQKKAMLAYAFAVAFGNIGRALIVVILIIQIAGSGGSYPIELLPNFFQQVYLFFPFPYAINSMREAIAGLYQNQYLIYILQLMLFFVIGLLIGIFAKRPLGGINKYMNEQLDKTEMM